MTSLYPWVCVHLSVCVRERERERNTACVHRLASCSLKTPLPHLPLFPLKLSHSPPLSLSPLAPCLCGPLIALTGEQHSVWLLPPCMHKDTQRTPNTCRINIFPMFRLPRAHRRTPRHKQTRTRTHTSKTHTQTHTHTHAASVQAAVLCDVNALLSLCATVCPCMLLWGHF